MTRVQIVSDLHFEFDSDRGDAFIQALPVVGDVLVLAGDILPLRHRAELERVLGGFCARFPHVIYVLGNHEYYKTRPAVAEALLASCARSLPNLHVLNPGEVEIGGVRFVGASLWFPHLPDEERLRPELYDFIVIEGFVPWVHETHAAHLAFLDAQVRPGDVVITHHLPHPLSVAAQFADSPLNRFFVAADAAELVERCAAKLWIHGHSHIACDYQLGATRVLCNPRGYPREAVPPIDLRLAIDL